MVLACPYQLSYWLTVRFFSLSVTVRQKAIYILSKHDSSNHHQLAWFSAKKFLAIWNDGFLNVKCCHQDLHLNNLAVAELVSAALLGATVGALCGQADRCVSTLPGCCDFHGPYHTISIQTSVLNWKIYPYPYLILGQQNLRLVAVEMDAVSLPTLLVVGERCWPPQLCSWCHLCYQHCLRTMECCFLGGRFKLTELSLAKGKVYTSVNSSIWWEIQVVFCPVQESGDDLRNHWNGLEWVFCPVQESGDDLRNHWNGLEWVIIYIYMCVCHNLLLVLDEPLGGVGVRTLTGIPIGVSSVLTNLYITEVWPENWWTIYMKITMFSWDNELHNAAKKILYSCSILKSTVQ